MIAMSHDAEPYVGAAVCGTGKIPEGEAIIRRNACPVAEAARAGDFLEGGNEG